MKVYLISGKAQHGKDTSAEFMRCWLEKHGENVLIAHYADLLKFICRQYFDWDGKKDDAGRALLQYVGTDVVRRRRPDYWADFLSEFLRIFSDEWDYVIIPDVRFPNEISRIEWAGFDTTHFRVRRPHFDSPLTASQQRHLSETALDEVDPDVWIENDGTLNDLDVKIQEWLKENAYD